MTRTPLNSEGSWMIVSIAPNEQHIRRQLEADPRTAIAFLPDKRGIGILMEHHGTLTHFPLSWNDLDQLEATVQWLRAWHERHISETQTENPKGNEDGHPGQEQ